MSSPPDITAHLLNESSDDGPSPLAAFVGALLTQARRHPGAYRRGRRRWIQEMDSLLDLQDLADPSVATPLFDAHGDIDIDGDLIEGQDLLFGLHTAYAQAVLAITHAHLAERPSTAPDSLLSPDLWAGLGIQGFVDELAPIFGWFASIDDPPLLSSHRQLFDEIWDQCRPQGATLVSDGAKFTDRFRPLYQALIPPAVRHRLGEYYTPDWLAERTLHQSGFKADQDHTLLDPACGSGTFLMAALSAGASPEQVQGIDLNPLAVLAARANLIIAHPSTTDEAFEPAVYWADAIPRRGTLDLFGDPTSPPPVEPVTHVVGNPPWVGWETLRPRLREALKPSWEHYGLFTLSGSEARLGGGKKELSMLFCYVCADHYLMDGGHLCFLMNRGVLTTTGAGDGFRRFRFSTDAGRSSNTVYLQPLSVDDYRAIQPFEGATTQTISLCLRRQTQPIDFPLPYRCHISSDPEADDAATQSLLARPLDDDAPGSPWMVGTDQALQALQTIYGPSHYRAREGANTGGLNGCYWVQELQHNGGETTIENLADVGKIKVPKTQCTIEPDLLYPLLRSRDLQRWSAHPQASIVLAQNPETRGGIDEERMQQNWPQTYAYLQRFEGTVEAPARGSLRGRALFKRYFEPEDPFYSMYGVGPYTIAPWKVCWRRIDTELRAAVVGPDEKNRPVIPQETITFVAFDTPEEAHFFCALFNSAWPNALVRRYSSGKGFASAHILEAIAIGAFDPNLDHHRRLSDLSQRAHGAAQIPDDDELSQLHARIDALAAHYFGLDDAHRRAL